MTFLLHLTELFNKKIVLVFLLTIAIFTSTGTLAYWSDSVQGTEGNSNYTFHIGSALPSSTLTFTDTINPNGYILPVNDMIRNTSFVEQVSFDVSWTTGTGTSSSWGGTTDITSATIEFTYGLTILISGAPANDTQYYKILNVLQVVPDPNNPSNLDLSTASASYIFNLSFNSNMDRDVYNLLRRADITITFDYTVTTQ